MRNIVKVNSEGRIVIPAGMRKELKIKDNDELSIEIESGDTIRIKTISEHCALCNNEQDLNHIDGLVICNECLVAIKHKLEEEPNNG